MHKDITLHNDARLAMKRGVDKVANTVKVTMGVRGKNVILDTNPYTKPTITNDGVTIARDLILEDRLENAGAKMIRSVAERTNDNAGDGTTTSMLLMQSIIDQGMKAIAAGADGIQLREGINLAVKQVVKSLESEKVEATDLDTLAATATISCRDPKIGELVAEVVKAAGKDGMVTIEDRMESDTTYERLEGLKLTGGLVGDLYVNLPERHQTVFNEVPILVTNKTITTANEMGRIMETVSNMGSKEAVVIAAGVEGDALLTSIKNWVEKRIFVLPVRVLTYGEMGEGLLKDVAAITGATYLNEHEKNIIDITQDDFGRAAKTVTDKHYTTVVSDDDEAKETRIKDLEVALKDAREFEAESMRERIAKLRSAMFTVKVGGKTEAQRGELKTRVDDAIKAAKAALESGVIAGGGSALYRAQHSLKSDISTDIGIGVEIIRRTCKAPIEQMALNSGYTLDRTDYDEILEDPTTTIDFKTCETVDAYDGGIIDPLKVVTECIENAAADAALFLTLDGAVVDVVPEKAEQL